MMRAFFGNQRGTAAIEFAICMPFLITLSLGAAEIGRALWCHHTIVESTRDATRYLSRVPDPTAATYQGVATNLVERGTYDTSGNLLIPASYGTVNATFAVTNVAGTWSVTQPTQGRSVTTTTTLTITIAQWFGGALSIPMTVTHTERVQTD